MQSTISRRTLRAAGAALACLLTASPVAAQQSLLPPGSSPRLVRLADAVAAGDPDAVATFWREVSASGAPLVEPDTAHPGHSLVTFVHRESDPAVDVALASNILSLDPEGTTNPVTAAPLVRLDDTDVLYLTFRLRNDARAPYRFRVTPRGGEAEEMADPLNDRLWEPDESALRASILELPGAPRQPWRHAGSEAGDWDELALSDGDGVERTVYVYKPAGWRDDRDEPYPALVGLGAYGTGVGMRVDWMADHLVDTGRLPPMVFLLADLGRGSEAVRYEDMDAFVADVLLPYAREHYGVSGDPADVAVSGTSRRGMVASLLALRRPEAVGKVISLSGSYYWKPTHEEEWMWVPGLYARSSRRPVRFYVASGEMETFVTPGNHGHYMVGTNRHFRDVLRARGYELTYVEFNGVHSELNWQDWLAEGLVHFFGRGSR